MKYDFCHKFASARPLPICPNCQILPFETFKSSAATSLPTSQKKSARHQCFTFCISLGCEDDTKKIVEWNCPKKQINYFHFIFEETFIKILEV